MSFKYKTVKPTVFSESCTLEGICILNVTVLTTGAQGGDSGHGGYTEIILEDFGSTDISATYDETKGKVTLRVGGDAEMHTLLEALQYSAKALERLIEKSNC